MKHRSTADGKEGKQMTMIIEAAKGVFVFGCMCIIVAAIALVLP